MELIKQLTYRSVHRGCKETDFLIGNFAVAKLSEMSQEELLIFSDFLQEDDMEIYDWILNKIDFPSRYNSIINQIRSFHKLD